MSLDNSYNASMLCPRCGVVKPCIAHEGWPDPIPAPVSATDTKLSLHRCKVCGTRWLLWPDAMHGGGWNLLDKYSRPGSCCDNVAMGDQIEHLRDFDLSALPASVAPPQEPIAISESARLLTAAKAAWLMRYQTDAKTVVVWDELGDAIMACDRKRPCEGGETADTADLKSAAERRAGSTPAPRTNIQSAPPAVDAVPPVPKDWEGDLATDHPNRCALRDRLVWADIFNDDGSHRPAWRCHKRAGHDGSCSSHNDCGVMNGGVVCGLLPGHDGPHSWQQFISIPASVPPRTET